MLSPYFNKNKIEVGLDEAGRGCLSGPVVAAAVILPSDFSHPLLNDSKKMSEKNRELLRPIIEQKAIAYAVAFVDNHEIDKINILNASILAMHKAIDQLKTEFNFLLVDGNRFKPYQDVPHECIVKGDGKYQSIAAASILAKTYRDDYMKMIDTDFPMYDWKRNKGYPTKKHVEAIKQFGMTDYHRISFHVKSLQLEFDF